MIIHGEYINLEVLKNGNLRIFMDDIQKESIELESDSLYSLIDCPAILGSGWNLIDGHDYFLHGGDMMIRNYDTDIQGRILLDTADIWYDSKWESKDIVKELKEKGEYFMTMVV